MKQLIGYFRQLAKGNCPASVFAEFSARLLAAWYSQHNGNGFSDVCNWISSSTTLPAQNDSLHGFGDPPFTIDNCNTASLELLLWRSGRTTIHQHSFSGAFCVLHGTSLHNEYEFRPEMTLDVEGFHLGRLLLRNTELLLPGDFRQILPGGDFIHSLFHIGTTSSTLLIRRREQGFLPQLSYLRPHVAINFQVPDLVLRKCEAVRTLSSLDTTHSFLSGCLAHANMREKFLYLLSGTEGLDPVAMSRLVAMSFRELPNLQNGQLESTLLEQISEVKKLREFQKAESYDERLSLANSIFFMSDIFGDSG